MGLSLATFRSKLTKMLAAKAFMTMLAKNLPRQALRPYPKCIAYGEVIVNWYLCMSSDFPARASEKRRPWKSFDDTYNSLSSEIILAGIIRCVSAGRLMPFKNVNGLRTIRLNVTKAIRIVSLRTSLRESIDSTSGNFQGCQGEGRIDTNILR